MGTIVVPVSVVGSHYSEKRRGGGCDGHQFDRKVRGHTPIYAHPLTYNRMKSNVLFSLLDENNSFPLLISNFKLLVHHSSART